MSTYTHEQLQELFRKSRERQEKLRLQQEAEKLALRASKKAHRQLVQRQEKEAQRAKEEALRASFLIEIRKEVPENRWIEPRGTNNLYSKHELQNIEELFPNETGRIRWVNWERIVEEVRNQIQKNI